MSYLLLFLPESPMLILFVVAAAFLLFGSSKLPQLAKSLGQTRKAFKEGMIDAEDEELSEAQKRQHLAANPAAPQVNSVSDEELMAELRRRAQAKQVN